MRFNTLNLSDLGYGVISLPFEVYVPDEKINNYSDFHRYLIMLAETVYRYRNFCNQQQANIEKKKKMLNNLYGSKVLCGVKDCIYEDAIKSFEEYSSRDINRELIDNLVGDLDQNPQKEEEKKNSVDGISW